MMTHTSIRWNSAIIAAGVATALTLSLTACAAPEREPEAAAADPVSGGTLTYLINQDPSSLDPAVNPLSVSALITRNIFDSLVVQSGPGTFEPWLADSWTISPDGLVYTFVLKQGVEFTDGTPFTAEAVKATLDYIVDPANKSQNATRLSAYTDSTAVDDHTVEIRLSEPSRPFLQALSSTNLGIQSPAQLALPADQYTPVGTGPFSFVSWDQQQTVVLERNPEYSSAPANAEHQGPAYLDELKFDLVTENATRYGALTSGQAQAIADVPASDVQALSETPGYSVQTALAPGINFNLYFNVSGGPTSDLLVRKALQAAIDVPSIVDSVYFGTAQVADGALSPTTSDYDASASEKLQSYDPEESARLLDDAGWSETNAEGYRTKDGEVLELSWPAVAGLDRAGRGDVAEAIQAQAKEVGVKIDRPSLDQGAGIAALVAGEYDIFDGSNSRPDADVLRDFFASTSTFATGGANINRVGQPNLDQWLTAGLTTADPKVAAESYASVQAEVLEQALVLPIFVGQYTLGVADSVHGVTFDQNAQPLLYDSWLSE